MKLAAIPLMVLALFVGFVTADDPPTKSAPEPQPSSPVAASSKTPDKDTVGQPEAPARTARFIHYVSHGQRAMPVFTTLLEELTKKDVILSVGRPGEPPADQLRIEVTIEEASDWKEPIVELLKEISELPVRPIALSCGPTQFQQKTKVTLVWTDQVPAAQVDVVKAALKRHDKMPHELKRLVADNSGKSDSTVAGAPIDAGNSATRPVESVNNHWRSSISGGQARAKELGLPLLIFWSTDDTDAGGQMERNLYSGIVRSVLRGVFIPVDVDPGSEPVPPTQLKISEDPTVVITDADLKELYRFEGLRTPEEIIAELYVAGAKLSPPRFTNSTPIGMKSLYVKREQRTGLQKGDLADVTLTYDLFSPAGRKTKSQLILERVPVSDVVHGAPNDESPVKEGVRLLMPQAKAEAIESVLNRSQILLTYRSPDQPARLAERDFGTRIAEVRDAAPLGDDAEPVDGKKVRLVIFGDGGATTKEDLEKLNKLVEEGVLQRLTEPSQQVLGHDVTVLTLQPKVSASATSVTRPDGTFGAGFMMGGGGLPVEVFSTPINPKWDDALRKLGKAEFNAQIRLKFFSQQDPFSMMAYAPSADARLLTPTERADAISEKVTKVFEGESLVVQSQQNHPFFGPMSIPQGKEVFPVYVNESGSPSKLLNDIEDPVDVKFINVWRSGWILERARVYTMSNSASTGNRKVVGILVSPEEADLLRQAERHGRLEAFRRDPQDTTTRVTPDERKQLLTFLEEADRPVAPHIVTSDPHAAGPSTAAPDVKIVQLQNADAIELASLLSQVIRSPGFSAVADARTNSIVLTSSNKETSQIAEALAARLDQPGHQKAPHDGASAPVSPDNPLAVPSARRSPASKPIADLSAIYAAREAEAASLASQLRARWPKNQTPDRPFDVPVELRTLRSKLETAVKAAFEARQLLLTAELEAMQAKLAATQRSIEMRNKADTEIVARRVEDLLNPDLKWNEPETPLASPNVPHPVVGAPITVPGPPSSPSKSLTPEKEAGGGMQVVVYQLGRVDVGRTRRMIELLAPGRSMSYDPAARSVHVTASKEEHARIKEFLAVLNQKEQSLTPASPAGSVPPATAKTADPTSPARRQREISLGDLSPGKIQPLIEGIGENAAIIVEAFGSRWSAEATDEELAQITAIVDRELARLEAEKLAEAVAQLEGIWGLQNREQFLDEPVRELVIRGGRAAIFQGNDRKALWRVTAVNNNRQTEFHFESLVDQPSSEKGLEAQPSLKGILETAGTLRLVWYGYGGLQIRNYSRSIGIIPEVWVKEIASVPDPKEAPPALPVLGGAREPRTIDLGRLSQSRQEALLSQIRKAVPDIQEAAITRYVLINTNDWGNQLTANLTDQELTVVQAIVDREKAAQVEEDRASQAQAEEQRNAQTLKALAGIWETDDGMGMGGMSGLSEFGGGAMGEINGAPPPRLVISGDCAALYEKSERKRIWAITIDQTNENRARVNFLPLDGQAAMQGSCLIKDNSLTVVSTSDAGAKIVRYHRSIAAVPPDWANQMREASEKQKATAVDPLAAPLDEVPDEFRSRPRVDISTAPPSGKPDVLLSKLAGLWATAGQGGMGMDMMGMGSSFGAMADGSGGMEIRQQPFLVIDADRAALYEKNERKRLWRISIDQTDETQARLNFIAQDGQAGMQGTYTLNMQGTYTLKGGTLSVVSASDEGPKIVQYRRSVPVIPPEWAKEMEKAKPAAGLNEPQSGLLRRITDGSLKPKDISSTSSSPTSPRQSSPRQPSDYLEMLDKYRAALAEYNTLLQTVGKDHPQARKLQQERAHEFQAIDVIQKEFQAELEEAARMLELNRVELADAQTALNFAQRLVEKGAATQAELRKQQSAAKSAEAKLLNAESRLKLFQSTRDSLFPPQSTPPAAAQPTTPATPPATPPAGTTPPLPATPPPAATPPAPATPPPPSPDRGGTT